MKKWSLRIFFTALTIYMTDVAAITIGHISVIDPKLGSHTLTYEIINKFAVVEGDILIGKAAILAQKRAIILSSIGGGRWPQGIIPFEIDEALPIANKVSVLEAIIHWQQKTHVEFVGLTSQNRDIYPDYIRFVPATGTTCASYVGKKGGAQEINLSPRCTTMNTVHEIGHALGLWHEQSRSDRDTYIRIIWENIEDDHRFNFEQHLNDGIDFGEYDYKSIMHYNAYAFSKNGEKTIIPLIADIIIGQREQLSDKDILAVNSMYPER